VGCPGNRELVAIVVIILGGEDEGRLSPVGGRRSSLSMRPVHAPFVRRFSLSKMGRCSCRAGGRPLSGVGSLSTERTCVSPTRGAIFTPRPVVETMLDWVALPPGFEGAILDPACGIGDILVAAGERSSSRALLAGVDIDPASIQTARHRLASLGMPRVQLAIGDALSRGGDLEARFDFVVMNPPYVQWHAIEAPVRAALEGDGFLGVPLRGRPRHRDAQPNLYLYFVVLGIRALKPGGRLCALIPDEWLKAPRAASFRGWLAKEVVIRHIVRYPERARPFSGRRAGVQVQTSSMLLVCEQRMPQPGHQVNVTYQVDRNGVAPRLACAWTPGDCSSVSDSFVDLAADADRGGRLAGKGIPRMRLQSAWGSGPWPPVGGARSLGPGCPALKDIPGVKVVAGHQPPVKWLKWLELCPADLDDIDAGERRVLVPAVRDAAEIGFPRVVARRFWVFLPLEMKDEECARRVFPSVMRKMEARLRAAIEDERAIPVHWWLFPNRRNMRLLMENTVRLLVPRTASRVRASLDSVGVAFKGTNAAIVVTPEAPVRVELLFGLLNAAQTTAWALAHGRDYHGKRLVLEPSVLKEIPIPLVDRDHPEALRMEALARRVLAGEAGIEVLEGAWARIHRAAVDRGGSAPLGFSVGKAGR